MALSIFGLILLASPFLLICKFKDKRLGFVYILSLIIAFQLFVAIVTQLFHVFNYQFILSINAIISLIIILKADFRKLFREVRPSLRTIDWVLILVAIVSFVCLFSVHYNYSGKYTVATNPKYQEGENIKYSYPYFADEWYAVAFIKDSIESHSLPLKNPLASSAWNERFINLEFTSHSFLAELMLLLHLDPLTDYAVLSIFSGLLIILLIYLFLRHSDVNKFPAAITSISALYLTNGANLPGIWYLIPLILGIISILLSFFFISENNKKMTLFMAVITLLFYPPLFVFYFLAILSLFILSKKLSLKKRLKNIAYYLMLTVLVAVVLSISYFLSQDPQKSFFNYIFSKIFYPTFTQGAIPQFSVYNIIPVPILILVIFGIISLIKTKKKIWLLSMLFLGLSCWILYSFILSRFIIEWERVIVFTSILSILVAGFGLNYLIEIFQKISFFKKNSILNYIQIVILILFLIRSFNYTGDGNWQRLKLVHLKSGQVFLPAAPANKYLHPDDLKLFKGIKNERFLSLPWKGTVIGIATANYPLSTKAGTITIDQELSSIFISADCNKKNEIARRRNISYVYFPEFECLNFTLMDISSEGLHLYKFSNSVQ